MAAESGAKAPIGSKAHWRSSDATRRFNQTHQPGVPGGRVNPVPAISMSHIIQTLLFG
jgi:hypothetical protein